MQFNQFDPSDPLNLNGTLTGVKFDLSSTITSDEFSSLSATLNVVNFEDGILSQNTTGPFIQTANRGPNAFFVGSGTYFARVILDVIFPDCDECTVGNASWFGNLSVTYSFDVPPSGVPLPAALPLFASGAAGLGVLGWRNRRKQKTKKA